MQTLTATALAIIGLFAGWRIARARAAWRMHKALTLVLETARINTTTEMGKAAALIGVLAVLVLVWVLR